MFATAYSCICDRTGEETQSTQKAPDVDVKILSSMRNKWKDSFSGNFHPLLFCNELQSSRILSQIIGQNDKETLKFPKTLTLLGFTLFYWLLNCRLLLLLVQLSEVN